MTVYGLGQFCLEKATLIPAQGAGGDIFSGCLLYGGLWGRFHFLPRDPEGTQKCAKPNNKFHSVATSDRLSEQCQLVGRGSLSPSECNQRWWENSRDLGQLVLYPPQSNYQCNKIVPEIQGPEAWSLGIRKQGPGMVLYYVVYPIPHLHIPRIIQTSRELALNCF